MARVRTVLSLTSPHMSLFTFDLLGFGTHRRTPWQAWMGNLLVLLMALSWMAAPQAQAAGANNLGTALPLSICSSSR
jgi:hypothetical protein